MHTFTTRRAVPRLPLLLAVLAGLPCLLLSARLPACAVADGADKADKKADKQEESKKTLPPASRINLRIAVAAIRDHLTSKEIEGDIAPPVALGENLTEMLKSRLKASECFVVYDSKPPVVSSESLPPGVIGDPDPEAAVKAAAGNGVAYLLTGFVARYANKKGGGGISIGGAVVGGKSGTASLEMDLRIIDTTTGEIIRVVHVRGSNMGRNAWPDPIHGDGCFGIGPNRSDPLVKAAQEAINNAVKGICQEIEKAQAAKITVSKPAASPSAHPL